MSKRGYALDMKGTGFGLIELGHHAIAVHVNPITDNLYTVLDEVDEPSNAYLPISSTVPGFGSGPVETIYHFDSEDGDGDLVYSYRKFYLLPYPVAFQFCQIKAEDYDNLLLNLYKDGALFFSRTITSQDPFRLPLSDTYVEFEYEIVGTSTVRSMQFVEDIRELV
jgi:hypothetical protein